MSNFFIDHPVFAWVIAILIVLAGVLSIFSLGVESYPNIAPPQVVVTAVYPGASASTAESTVTQVIEQQLTGIDHLLYFSSSTSSSGRVQITLTFQSGTDPDIAQVQVQNKVALATPRLPSEVTQQGVVVAKANSGFLMLVALQSDNPNIDQARLNDIVASQVLDQVSRVPGVGSTLQFGAPYAMRIWLNPDKLHGYGLSATQALNAIRTQNVQFAVGALGADPEPKDWGYTVAVSGESRFTTPAQFRNIILRVNPAGTAVTLGDVAQVGFGPESYGFNTEWNGKPVAVFAIQLLPGANALNVATAVRGEMANIAASFPQGVSWFTPYDSTTFVKISVDEVMKTLFEAIALVFLVMLLFLQNLRATIIPTLVIPIALLGAFLGMKILGFTINQLTMFGMVLAIGIVVDDAIVVVENVERLMSEEGLSPKEAARKGMSQISGAVVAITVVLVAVFVPSAMQPGASGIIYRQFALTLAVSMVFSAFLALSFTPSLCASLLRPESERGRKNIVFRKFNQFFAWVTHTYTGHIGGAVRHAPRWMAVYVVVAVLAGFLYTRVPGSFLPEEDQGYAMAMIQLPPGATLHRTEGAMQQMREVLSHDQAVDGILQISGFSFMGSGENAGMAFIKLKDWSKRDVTAMQFIQRANLQMHQKIRDAQIFLVNVPTVSGLGQFGGFDMFLENRSGSGRPALAAATGTLLTKAAQDPLLTGVHPNALPDAPQLDLSVDRLQAASMGLSVSDIYNAISLMLAPVYVNDFTYGGRVKRVMMEAAGPFRKDPDALQQFFTPSSTQTNSDGMPAMIPIANVVQEHNQMASPALARYNGYPAIEIVGSPSPGHASGEAMNAMTNIVHHDLAHGFGFDWTGQSYQEVLSGNTATLLLLLSIVIVFLALAALYESWSIPIAVLLIVPLTILGVVLFTLARGLADDIYFKIGMITVIGLAAKNAILIVEYAVDMQKQGLTLRAGVLEAAKLRFRPILMTSLAFMLGVFPLFISTGAGANARRAIGTGVIGGMIFATFFGLLLIPVFYVAVRRLHGDKLDDASPGPQEKPPLSAPP